MAIQTTKEIQTTKLLRNESNYNKKHICTSNSLMHQKQNIKIEQVNNI